MKRLVYAIMTLMLLSLTILSGCGGGGGGGNDGGAGPYTVTINVYDADKEPLNDVELRILETGAKETINRSHRTILDRGTYTVYLSKDNITRGFVFNLTSALTLQAYLSGPENEQPGNKGTVTGSVTDYAPDSGYRICAGNKSEHVIMPEDDIFRDSYSVETSSGRIVISAYSVDSGDKIRKIAYFQKTLEPSGFLEQNLAFPAKPPAVTYSGTKAADAKLSVQLPGGFYLAEQMSHRDFSFDIKLEVGDRLILESTRPDGDAYYLTRKAAGSSGGNFALQDQSETPSFTINDDSDNYILDINPVSFATHYEVYALQYNGEPENGILTYTAVVLSGLKLIIPNEIISKDYDNTLIYVRAVKLSQFNTVNILSGVQNYDEYSYVETGDSYVLKESAMAFRVSSAGNRAIEERLRVKLRLNKLLSEH